MDDSIEKLIFSENLPSQLAEIRKECAKSGLKIGVKDGDFINDLIDGFFDILKS